MCDISQVLCSAISRKTEVENRKRWHHSNKREKLRGEKVKIKTHKFNTAYQADVQGGDDQKSTN
jgi:hypothetical protein